MRYRRIIKSLLICSPGQLGEHDADHEGLNHHTSDALEAHDEDRLGTFLGGGPATIPDRMLRLHAEQETGSEAVDVRDAGK